MAREEAAAALARVLGHETCIRLLDALGAGEATVSDLACRLRLDQPRVSSHLGLLRQAGLVTVERRGRHHAYATAGEAPLLALAALRTLAGSLRESRFPETRPAPGPAAPIRRARTCYDHLAGAAGVGLLDAFLERGWLRADGGRDYVLSAEGAEALGAEGVEVDAARQARRAFAIACPDWTERRPHLGGALGAAVLRWHLRTRRARLVPGSREVRMKRGAAWPA